MAKAGITIEVITCSVCLDFLKDPVTIPCGHSYCMSCIEILWKGNRVVYSCHQCRQSFTKRPVLVKSTMLADLVEQLKKTGLQAAGSCYAGPQDVACDVCTGRKLRAAKSCLQCLASYCERHLQPHYQSPAFGNHQLVAPSSRLQENICSQHNKVMEMFCRTDHQCICYLCSVDQHRGHDVTSAAAEKSRGQRELEVRRQEILRRIQVIEQALKTVHQEALSIRRSVEEAVRHCEEGFSQLLRLMEDTKQRVEQQIRSLQQREERKVQEVQDKLERDMSELRRSYSELETQSQTQDTCVFLHNYPPVSTDTQNTHSSTVHQSCFMELSTAVSTLTKKLHLSMTEGLNNFTTPTSPVQELPPKAVCLLSKQRNPVDLMPKCVHVPSQPQTREEFLRYWRELTLDPNTAHQKLSLSDGNRRATLMMEHQKYPEHPDRFSSWLQALSRECLIGRCYWEVQWNGEGGVFVAVSYKDIKRQGDSSQSGFGLNDKCWALCCDKTTYRYWFNDVRTSVQGPLSPRIGVYLDHTAGVLSFYSISQTMTLLHRVHTKFTQPLYAGLRFWYPLDTAHICKPN